MKRYVKELVILILQLFMFYIFPLFAGPTEVIAMVLLMLMATVLLGLILGIISGNKIKFLYPVVVAIVFLPTIPIYYNESARIHSVWYLVMASIGLLPGAGIHFLFRKIKKKKS